MLLKACLNGARAAGSHPALPITPDQLAAAGLAAVAAGAGALHIHPRNRSGAQSLHASDVGAAVSAVRAASPSTPVGVTTIALAETDPAQRLALVRGWEVLPDFASVNLAEAGSADLIDVLGTMNVSVEAGLASAADARLLVALGVAERCLRVLIEPHDRAPDEALATAKAIIAVLDDGGIWLPRLLHGFNATAWPLLDTAIAFGYDTRIGLEDTFHLPDGRSADDNSALVAAARTRIAQAKSPAER
jgi:uncharacterized protein (DUF849 family)